jgi:Leucine Rich repeat
MSGPKQTEPGWRETARLFTHFLAIGLIALAGCQGFPGTLPSNPTGILGDDVLTTTVKGMTPAEANQLKQHRLALQIKKAGGDVEINMALYPASTVVGVDLHQTHALDADLLQLKAFPNLRTLNLYGTHITDAGLENISTLRTLQTLRLANTEITDAGLLSLQKLPDLHELGLSNTKITDQGCATLATMKGLTELSLTGSQITDAGLKQLQTLTRLKKLVLTKTSATKAGVAQLQRAVPDAHIFFG